MSRAGFRQLVAAVAFRFCTWRADVAADRAEREADRRELWEDRAYRCRQVIRPRDETFDPDVPF